MGTVLSVMLSIVLLGMAKVWIGTAREPDPGPTADSIGWDDMDSIGWDGVDEMGW